MLRSLCLSASFLALCVVLPVSAEDPPALIAQWSVPAGSKIVGIDIDASDNVYVTAREKFRVYKFDPSGIQIAEWWARCPVGMGVDSAGFTYTGDQCENQVQRFDPSGVSASPWTSHAPFYVTVDHNDYVYATDYTGGKVYKYDTSGNLISTFGSLGSGEGEICNPHGVAVDRSDNVFVTDNCNRVQKFSPDGEYVTQWYGGDSSFVEPRGLVVDSAGDVYVLGGGNKIQKFDNDGNFIVSWGGGFNLPTDIALDSAENLYVADTFNDLIKIFASPVATVSCAGFEPPMANYPVTVKKNRALPLKTQVLDNDGYALTGTELTSPPVVQVWYEYGTPNADDVTDDSLPAGEGTEGNQFVFTDDGKWQFNLKTMNYNAQGIYTVFMDSGDDTEYVIDPTCETQFVIR